MYFATRKKLILATAGGFAVIVVVVGGWYFLTHRTQPATGQGLPIATNGRPLLKNTAPDTQPTTSAGTTPPVPTKTSTTSSIATALPPTSSSRTSTSTPVSPSGSTGTSGSSGNGTSTSWWSSSTAGSGTLIPANQLNTGGCDYQEDTWSGDANGVGYSVTPLSNSDGNPASFSVKINAHANNQEVVGYPSVQCLLYEALPSNLNSVFRITPPASSSGLDYEYAYDIWLTTETRATSYDWDNDLELMVWNYTVNQKPAGYYDGGLKTTLPDGSKVYVDGDNSTGIVSVLMPQNLTSGSINIAALVSQLKSLGYVNSSYNGILDVEYGIEAPYGGNQTFTVNSLSLMN